MKIYKVFARVYTAQLEETIAFYEKLTDEKNTGINEFKGGGMDLKTTTVGNFLLLNGSEEALEFLKRTNDSIVVDSVKEFKEFLLANGGTIVVDEMESSGVTICIIKHKDGLVIEYMQF